MLRREIIDAVNAGKFRVFAVKTIEEGIEILTGRKAGKKDKKHAFTKGSVHFLVDQTLAKYAKRWKELAA
jgi:ATP-dependent Lon protease